MRIGFGALLLLIPTIASLWHDSIESSHTAAQGPEGFRLGITSFAATRAYAVGMQSLLLVGSVTNQGEAPVPSEVVTLRMYAVNGLDYLEGATAIRLPAMPPGTSATYRWKVQPVAPDAPLVAALVLERTGYLPEIRLLPIQHFPARPAAFGSPGPAKPIPAAAASGSAGWVENGRVRARLICTGSGMGTLFLWARTAGGWRQTALAMPLAEVLSGEPAQEPWWEGFKVKRCTAAVSRTDAALHVAGQIGVRWTGVVTLRVHRASSVVDVDMSLTPRRAMLLHGLRTSRLHVGDGSFGSSASEVLEPQSTGRGITAAVRWGTITTGMVWPTRALLPAWTFTPLAPADGADYRLLGAEYRGMSSPVDVQSGGAIRMRWRLFTLTPSTTVRDAFKVAPPH